MAYTALYRALRPKTFKDVVEQEHIVRTLLNQINSNRISHAYLFCGTRGTGKTSVAKIFAKAVNCQSPEVSGEPCGLCESCTSADAGRSLNILEIDAASNNGVENIRDIREEVKYTPAQGLYKVYIIDEVHMLSTGAFNALLKTLEEPPQHVIFILATTDPQKIPATILSRCQRFDFKRISPQGIASRIQAYVDSEGISIEKEAVRYIASVSDGALRDALSILDQCVAFYFSEDITLQKVLDIMGSVDKSVFFHLTDALSAYDSRACMEIIESAVRDGRDISQFVAELILHFRNELVALAVGTDSTALSTALENITELIEQGQRIGAASLVNYIGVFSELKSQLRYAPNERVMLEVACIKICNPQESDRGEALIPRIEKLENTLKNGIPAAAYQAPQKEPAAAPEIAAPKRKKAVPEDIKKVAKDWGKFCRGFGMPLRGFLEKSNPRYLEGDSLMIITKDLSSPELLKRSETEIKEALAKAFDCEYEIKFICQNEYDALHKKIYGVTDDGIIDADSFTEVFGNDIIIE